MLWALGVGCTLGRADLGKGQVCVVGAPRAGFSCRHRLSLLERVSAEAVTTTLHHVTRERMEDRCRGEYERSFLREFHKVRVPSWAAPRPPLGVGMCFRQTSYPHCRSS